MQAFLAGGANMFQASEDSRIATVGEKNLQAVHRVLAELSIPVLQEDTGGVQGRTVCFDGENGSLQVKTLQRIAWRREAE
jgi:chemotaxis protein CheD